MSMTMTQKILAAHAGKNDVHAGELIMARLDLVLANDITAPVAIGEFRKGDKPRITGYEFHVFCLATYLCPQELVMEKLKDLDPVAYVRFASVYREFKDVDTFMQELTKLLEHQERRKR